MNNLKIFENAEFGRIRTVVIDGEPWFVGRDVAGALEYNEPHKAVVKHVMEEDRTKYPTLTDGGMQEMWVINESGLYSLIFSSKLDSAKKFKHWVTAEVLPSIRKTGAYSMVEYPADAALLKGLASAGNLIRSAMKDEKAKPYEVAIVLDSLFKQGGINLPNGFIRVPEYEQMSIWDFKDRSDQDE